MRALSVALAIAVSLVQSLPGLAETIKLEEGTPVQLKLVDALNTKESVAGQKVQFTVAAPVLASDGKTVMIKEGASGDGFLLNSDERETGHGGKLSIEIRSAKAVDGSKVPLRGMKTQTGKGGAGIGTYLISFACLGILGVGLAAVFGKSKNATIPAGTIITAFVDKDVDVPQTEATAKHVEAQIIAIPEANKNSSPRQTAAVPDSQTH